jgi:hypothetical protein
MDIGVRKKSGGYTKAERYAQAADLGLTVFS